MEKKQTKSHDYSRLFMLRKAPTKNAFNKIVKNIHSTQFSDYKLRNGFAKKRFLVVDI